jgi:hypothetical protein
MSSINNLKSSMGRHCATVLLGVSLVLISCIDNPTGTPGVTTGIGYSVPAGRAWAEGKEIRFTHTEISDADLAITLTNMMKSPVLVVKSLELIPDSLLANVYVFANGVAGAGPLKYQSDVFDKPPSTAGYTPLRRLHVVSWKDTTAAQLLKSVAEIDDALRNDKITIDKKSVVINMPFIVWADGQR